MSEQNQIQIYHDNQNNNFNNNSKNSQLSKYRVQRKKIIDPPILFNDMNRPKSEQQDQNFMKLQIKDVSRINRNNFDNTSLYIDESIEKEIDEMFQQNGNHSVKSCLDPQLQFQLPASLLNQLKIIKNKQNIKNKDESKFKKLYFQEQDDFPLKSRLYSIANQSSKKERCSSSSKRNEFQLQYDLNKISPQHSSSIRTREKKIQSYTFPVNNNSLVLDSYGYLQKQKQEKDIKQDYSYQFNLNHNIEKKNSIKLKSNKQLTQNSSISQQNSFEDEGLQRKNNNDNYKPYQPYYDPDKDINYDNYNKKQTQIIKGLQYKYMRNKPINTENTSINSIIRTSFRSNSNNQNQFNSNNKSFITQQNSQRGQSASLQNHLSLYNYSISPQKSLKSNKRYLDLSHNEHNKSTDIQQEQQLQLKQNRKTIQFYDQNKNNNEQVHSMYGRSELRIQTSPIQQGSQRGNNLFQPISNTFSFGSDQVKNQNVQFMNKSSSGQEINILQQNNSKQKDSNQQKNIYQIPDNIINNQATDPRQIHSSHNHISNSQQPSKLSSYRQSQSKKIVKEEVLDKELVRKIIDRVEKLLCEKEEKLPCEQEVKVNERQSYEKQEEQSLPEQNFNHHLKLITEVVKSKSQQDSALASFLKGVGRMKKNKDRSAITAFKQALNFDKAHFPTIYNLACIYERNKRFKCAETWLEIANMFKRNKNDINYGFAIIYFKSSRFEESYIFSPFISLLMTDSEIFNCQNLKKGVFKKKINYIQHLIMKYYIYFSIIIRKIDTLIDELSKSLDFDEKIPQTHLYLRSLCAKKLGQQSIDKDKTGEDKLNKSMSYFESRIKSQSIKISKIKQNISKQLSKEYKLGENQHKGEENEEEGKQNKNEQLLITPSSSQYFQKASEDYKAFIQYTCPKNFMLLKHFMFAVVFKKIRKMEIKFPPHIFCEFFSLVKQILASETYEPALEPIIKNEESEIQNGYAPPIYIGKIPTGLENDRRANQYPPLIQSGVSLKLSLFDRRKEEIAKKISNLSFFKRFPAQTISYFLPNFELRYIEKSELLFAQKGEVYIITGGQLIVYDHSKQFNQPDIVAYYSEGDIIGCDDKDNKISFHPDIWFLSLTRIEYVVIPESDFLDLWNLQNDIKSRQILNFIRQIDIFDKVSQLTLYRLAFELFKEKTFQNKDIVFNDAESIHKYHYIELHKEDPKTLKNLKNRINNKIDILPLTQLAIQGFYIIQEGSLELSSFSNWQSYVLRPYNFIGENLLFPTLSISRFGQIVCSSYQSKCLFLSRYDFDKLSSLDKDVMKSNILKSDYHANCQRILHKYYKHHKIQDFDQATLNNNN